LLGWRRRPPEFEANSSQQRRVECITYARFEPHDMDLKIRMRSDAGNTTITEAAELMGAGLTHQLALKWLFPHPSTAAVSLDFEGPGELTIGRDEQCSVHLQGDGVSRRHAAVTRTEPGAPIIVDLGSRNGTRVNGKQVASTRLARNDVVRLGGWVGVVTAVSGEFGEVAPGLLGGAALRAALSPLIQAATSDLPIILEGETGTGKEVVARSLHRWSGRSGPLVAVNCASLPETLAEAELFGYRRGAFTGADRAAPGFFRSATGGTILLDEVSDLPLPLQAKLLRVLEQREVQPLGEAHPVPIDVRVVVAGQQSLEEAARTGRFRPDLLARLDGVTVQLPPLRDRREDVPPLFSHFLREFRPERVPAIESDLVERLCLHDWPFNVRELVLLVRRLLVVHEAETTLSARHLPARIGDPTTPAAASSAPGAEESAESIELPALLSALRASGGNVSRASALVGISRQRAYRMMDENAVDLQTFRKRDGATDD
jgi:transcriptional regulator of acetoin/glycerol metabolism